MTSKNIEVVYPTPTPEGVILEKNLYAPMRDGVKLAMDVYKPAEGKGPWPVIIGYSGFAKERFFESALPAFWCKQGYVCVQLQARGTGFSEGKWGLIGPQELWDGYDAIEWIAAQPWCTGNVGMMGASYFAVTQWVTAAQNPPHLKCIVPCPGFTNMYEGLYYPGGVFRSQFVLMLLPGGALGAVWPGLFPGKEIPDDFTTPLFYHTEYNEWYETHGSTWRRIGKITVPVLSICPGLNELHITTHLRSYTEIKTPKKLLITPWTESFYQPFIFETTSLNQYVLRWFDHWLKGIDTGIMDEPEIAIYDNGTGKWRYENEYPLARTEWKKFYLRAKSDPEQKWGLLKETPPKEEASSAYKGPSLPGKTQYVAFVTPPLEEDLTIKGPLSMTLYASTTEEVLTDWSFFVKVGELPPEGALLNPVTQKPQTKSFMITTDSTPPEVHLWSYGNLKAKFREVDESLSKPEQGQPRHSFQNPAELKPNTVYEFQIELLPMFNTFKKGHRIWVQVSGEDATHSTWDPSSRYVKSMFGPDQPLKNTVSVYHDTEHPSHLLLPVIPDAPEIGPVKAPLSEVLPGAERFV